MDNRAQCGMAIACWMHDERGRKGDPPQEDQKGTSGSGTTTSQRKGFLQDDADRVQVLGVLLART